MHKTNAFNIDRNVVLFLLRDFPSWILENWGNKETGQ